MVEIHVKRADPSSRWIWGGFKMPGHVFHRLDRLWRERHREDEFFGTLVNAYLADGGRAKGVKAGEAYVDVGTFNGYRAAIGLLGQGAPSTGRTAATADPANGQSHDG